MHFRHGPEDHELEISGKGARQASTRGKSLTVLSNYDAYETQQQPAWHDNRKDAVLEHISW